MEGFKEIRTALVSVYCKENLDLLITELNRLGVRLFSTGGTHRFIESLGVPVETVESLTGYPSILGGRVKTLHPKVFGGILGRRDHSGDLAQFAEYGIPAIDLVVVDLYPFEETLAGGAPREEIIEKIDIGGITLIRAAAKNYADVLVVPSRGEYLPLLELLKRNGNGSTLAEREWFAARAFGVSSKYDAAIFSWMNRDGDSLRIALDGGHTLRYGENPHQEARFFRYSNTKTPVNIGNARVLQGKELSYNNLLDADAAWKSAGDACHAVSHLPGKAAVSVVKHLNPCGLAVAGSLPEALELAWAGDPVSAYGGIVCFTEPVGDKVAAWFEKRFVEILIAPGFSPGALEILSKKKNLRLLVAPVRPVESGETVIRSVSGAVLIQQEDEGPDPGFTPVTTALFPEEMMGLARFGVMACKHLKSNAIALITRNSNGSVWLAGAGMGQPNRLDSLRLLSIPRFMGKQGPAIENALLVSDAFFPFSDSIEAAREAGIRYIVQPGGSIRDQEVIDACNQYGIAMLFTGRRHFRH